MKYFFLLLLIISVLSPPSYAQDTAKNKKIQFSKEQKISLEAASLSMQASLAALEGNTDKEKELLKQALELSEEIHKKNPDDLINLRRIGSIKNSLSTNSGNVEIQKVINITSKNISEGSTNARDYINRAFSYRELNDFEKAIEDYETAIDLDPDNTAYPLHLRATKQAKKSKEFRDSMKEDKSE